MIKNTPAAWDERARSADTSWEAAMWSEESQHARFDLVAKWLAERCSAGEQLLDYGCGDAHLADTLHGVEGPAGFFCGLAYFGWDWSPDMRARAHREHPDVTILDDDPLNGSPPFDYVVAIGPFNLSDQWSRHDTIDCVAKLWPLTRKTMIVSLYSGQEKPGMIRYTGDDVMRLHDRIGYPGMTVTTEHLPNDWMVRFTRSQS